MAIVTGAGSGTGPNQLDVTSRASTRDAAAQVIDTHEHFDILVDNPRIYGDMGRVMAVNMFGLWIMSSSVPDATLHEMEEHLGAVLGNL